MGGVSFATWPLEDFLWFLARVGAKRDQAILAFVFLGAAFAAQLVGGASGEALALGTFSDCLNIGQPAAFVAELGHRETGKSQKKDKRSQRI